MTTLAMITLRTSVVLAAALLGYVACRRQSAALRHFILAVGVCAGLLVTPLGPVLPAWHVTPPASWSPEPPRTASAGVTADPHVTAGQIRARREPALAAAPVPLRARPLAARLLQAATPGALLTLAWLIGLAAVIVRLGLGLVGLARWSARTGPVADVRWLRLQDAVARELNVTRPVTLVAGDVPVICTWGVFRPRIVLPAHAVAWSEERARVVLCHELAHVRRGDWAVQFAGELLRAVFWFNPLTWIVCRRLRDEAEHACDDVVLRAGVRDHAYVEQVLGIRMVADAAPSWPRPCRWPVHQRSRGGLPPC